MHYLLIIQDPIYVFLDTLFHVGRVCIITSIQVLHSQSQDCLTHCLNCRSSLGKHVCVVYLLEKVNLKQLLPPMLPLLTHNPECLQIFLVSIQEQLVCA